MPAESKKIKMSPETAHFYQGVSAGSEVRKAHEAFDSEPLDVRLGLYWFYVGALAAGEYGLSTQEEFAQFIQGASLRKPEKPDDDPS